ncbi:MAG: hypothetical protein MUE32_10870 [Bacteroidales bacterium]|jgi:hypothetical protein|nr:hypothetical protein [Bacteroidales bacterium]
MKTRLFSFISIFLLGFFTACDKDSALIEQASLDLADDDAVSEAVYEDVFSTADNAAIIVDYMLKGDSKSDYVVTDSCPSVSVTQPSTGSWPKVITVDYGKGCTGFYEATRSGKILIEVTGPRLETGSKRTVTFNNYYFNGIKVEGTKVIENTGLNNNGNIVFSVSLTGGKLTLAGGKTIERTVDHEREWIAGYQTKNIWDDECLVTGTASGKTLDGKSYTNTIMSALHWKRVCKFLVSGAIRIERGDAEPFELNYGEGECDAKAVVSRGGESKEILLRNRHRLMGTN